ncbi:unnamed protein product, partial [Iphiclides podalirius]
MWRRGGLGESPALTPRPGASPGLLRRRYSVPETVMRKYRLAQLNSEDASRTSAETCSCCALPEPAPRLLRRDRELMRRSALLRRLHGRACRACCCGGCECSRATRSLDASQSELRPSSIARRSPASGRTSPKRLRLESPTPQERSSLSMDSPNNEQTQSRRASVPTLADSLLSADSDIDFRISRGTPETEEKKQQLKVNSTGDQKAKDMRSAGTSPMSSNNVNNSALKQRSEKAISSPLQRSAATSPIRNFTMSTQTPLPRRKSISNQLHQSQQQQHQRNKIQQTGTPPRTQQQAHELPRTQQLQQKQPRLMRHRVAPELAPRQHLVEGGGIRLRDTFTRRRSVSSQREAERLPRCGNGHGERLAAVRVGAESGAAGGASGSSSSSESGGSLLCPLAPAWLQARRRRRRANAAGAGRWAVTVAGSCAAALPADVEMRLRFPGAQQQPRATATHAAHAAHATHATHAAYAAHTAHAAQPAPRHGEPPSPPSSRRAQYLAGLLHDQVRSVNHIGGTLPKGKAVCKWKNSFIKETWGSGDVNLGVTNEDINEDEQSCAFNGVNDNWDEYID